jgi:CRP-like cAMP-binding protein/Fe-S-cluster-containing hydrogenase component 2
MATETRESSSGSVMRTLTVTLDDKTFPITLELRRNQHNDMRFFASVAAEGRRQEVEVGAEPEVTIWDAARLWDMVYPNDPINIPGLCHRPELGYQAAGVCRLCSVGVVENGRVGSCYSASCMKTCKDGMVVLAADEAKDSDDKLAKARTRLREARKTLVELLLAEHPIPCQREKEQPGTCELEAYGRRYGLLKPLEQNHGEAWITPTVFAPRAAAYIPVPDRSNFSIAIDHAACILCDRCVRACSHPEVDHKVIGRTGKGMLTRIGFDNDLPMKESSCVNCGWCMVSCPTGAITYSGGTRSTDSPWPDGGIALSPKEMSELELVKGNKISVSFLERSGNGVVVRRFKKGDVICRQGEYGRTAFYINSGKVDIFVNLPAPSSGAGKAAGFFSRLMGAAPNPLSGNPTRTRPFMVAPEIQLDPQRPVASLAAGTLFGEEACLNSQPRSATVVVAEDDTEIVVMFRNFLDILTRNRAFRTRLETNYRRWAIENHLKNSRYMQGLPEELRGMLRERATIVRFSPGERIFSEGDVPDAFYMIRLGHVRVLREAPGMEEQTLRYMTPGEVFGEIGALFGVKRTTTCTAIDNVQLVRISREDFLTMVGAAGEVRMRLEERAIAFLENDGSRIIRDSDGRVIDIVAPLPSNKSLPERRSPSLKQYLDQELFQGQHMLVLDLEKCTRCDECVTACAQSHLGISRLIRDGLRFDKFLVTTSCRSCRDPKCLVGCPVDAIHRTGSLPIIIENHCVGCGKCAENCPYGNIALHPVEVQNPFTGQLEQGRQATVCNLDNCIEEGREPSCVYACPHDAAHRVDGSKFFGPSVLGESV